MACNENIVKNMAMEVTRECQSQNVTVETDFVIFLIELLLKNPKYGKLFSKTLNRTNLEFFVNEVVKKLVEAEVSMSIIKMQFTMHTNYDRLQKLVNNHIEHIENTLHPLVTEILDDDPDIDAEEDIKKLHRKISVYLILASGLGSPSSLVTLKEGMAALDSVFNFEDCQSFVTLTRQEKLDQLAELLDIVSGVRLFNRDCEKGGEGIPDLPSNLVEAGSACLSSLSNTLLSIMQRVNLLTAAVEDRITFEQETGNVVVEVLPDSDLSLDDYEYTFDLLAFNRQYEIFVRMLLANIETLVQGGGEAASRTKEVLKELHAAVEYRAAVPVATVFPLFTKLWKVWRDMQNIMFLVSTINKIAHTLNGIQEQTKVAPEFLDRILRGKKKADAERARYSVISLKSFVGYGHAKGEPDAQNFYMGMLGFCAVCMCVGALVPSNMRVSVVRHRGRSYGFCSHGMAARFSKEPERYMNEVIDYARNHPHIINLLGIQHEVEEVKDIEVLVKKVEPKIQVQESGMQTELHPIPSHIDRDYTWNMWEWKRRACHWANLVNCRTHSTQTHHSHMRSEIQCQTVEPRDKCLQTMNERGVNTLKNNVYIHGLRGSTKDPLARTIDMTETHLADRRKAVTFSLCTWPCTTTRKSRSKIKTETIEGN